MKYQPFQVSYEEDLDDISASCVLLIWEMDSLSKSHFLSSEDEVELARSNNKVKDVHRANFKISQGESPINNIGTTSLRGMAYHSKTSSRVKC